MSSSRVLYALALIKFPPDLVIVNGKTEEALFQGTVHAASQEYFSNVVNLSVVRKKGIYKIIPGLWFDYYDGEKFCHLLPGTLCTNIEIKRSQEVLDAMSVFLGEDV